MASSTMSVFYNLIFTSVIINVFSTPTYSATILSINLNDGSCVAQNSRGRCICPLRLGTLICMTISKSKPFCINTPESDEDPKDFACVCRHHYRDFAEISFDYSCYESCFHDDGSDRCQNGGICHQGNDFCSCPTPFYGLRCEREADYCDTYEPCPSNARCRNLATSKSDQQYVCECPPGLTGPECDQNTTRPCDVIPCGDHGNCIDDVEVDDFRCACDPGYEGPRCETKSECGPGTCLNGGSCLNGTFLCNCDVTGYTGMYCEVPQCKTHNPCHHDGVCVDVINGVECRCHKGFSGSRCEIDFDDCASNPCQHGGTCYDRSDRKNYETLRGLRGCGVGKHRTSTRPIFKHRIRYEISSGYFCKCRKGVVGEQCETNLCINHTCPSNTHCVAFNHTTPACACNHGYHVDEKTLQCVDRDECKENRPFCLNGGKCRNTIGSWYCKCRDPRFTGQFCHLRNPCWDSRCHLNVCQSNINQSALSYPYITKITCLCEGPNPDPRCFKKARCETLLGVKCEVPHECTLLDCPANCIWRQMTSLEWRCDCDVANEVICRKEEVSISRKLRSVAMETTEVMPIVTSSNAVFFFVTFLLLLILFVFLFILIGYFHYFIVSGITLGYKKFARYDVAYDVTS